MSCSFFVYFFQVFFLSSRVHPGETPSSFVFSGLLDFILRKNDPRAAALRDLFVFKMIPLLNPDGVKRGYYRTDTKGTNLNRMYLNPDLLLHPSIYAAKSVILYHHSQRKISDLECTCGMKDNGFRNNNNVETHDKSYSGDKASHLENENVDYDTDTFYSENNKILSSDTSNDCIDMPSDNTEQISQRNRFEKAKSFESMEISEISEDFQNVAISKSETSLPEHRFDITSIYTDKHKVSCGGNEKERTLCIDNLEKDNESVSYLLTEHSYSKLNRDNVNQLSDHSLRTGKDNLESMNSSQPVKARLPQTSSHPVGNISDGSSTKNLGDMLHSDQRESSTEEISHPNVNCACAFSSGSTSGKDSGIAIYVDLHGHASKRGCFMYGNRLEKEEDQILSMLLPKLISINSPNFDFNACNFTERNMYSKDKRDGLSKEGSGRVAIHKATGIIHR